VLKPAHSSSPTGERVDGSTDAGNYVALIFAARVELPDDFVGLLKRVLEQQAKLAESVAHGPTFGALLQEASMQQCGGDRLGWAVVKVACDSRPFVLLGAHKLGRVVPRVPWATPGYD